MKFLRFVPGSLSVGIVPRDGKVHLVTSGGQASFKALDLEEYPPLPQVAEEAMSAWVDGDELVRGVSTVEGCAAREETRPVLTAVCLTLAEPMEVATADGFRLAVLTLRTGFPGGDGRRALLPHKAARVMARLWRMAPGPAEAKEVTSIAELAVARRPIRLTYDEGQSLLQAAFGKVTVLSRLVQGTYPDYPQLIPQKWNSRVTVLVRELLQAVLLVAEVARDGSGTVRLRWQEGRLTVAARAEEVGETETAVPARVEGKPGRIAFNVRYLLDYLKGRDGVVTMETTDPSGPALFRHRDLRVVIMPMYVNDEEAPKAAEESDKGEAPAEAQGNGEPEAEVENGAEATRAKVRTQAQDDSKPKHRRKRSK